MFLLLIYIHNGLVVTKICLVSLPGIKDTFSIGTANPSKSGTPGKIFLPKPVGMIESLARSTFQINSTFCKLMI